MERTERLHRPSPWGWSVIAVIMAAIVIGSVVAAGIAFGGNPASSSGNPSFASSGAGETVFDPSSSSSGIKWAEPRQEAGLVRSIHTKPGRPEEARSASQVVASFVLLSSRGEIDLAMQFTAPLTVDAEERLHKIATLIYEETQETPIVGGVEFLVDEEHPGRTTQLNGGGIREVGGEQRYLMWQGNTILGVSSEGWRIRNFKFE